MPEPLPEDPRVKRLIAICGALPETTHEFHEDFIHFRVRKKVFAYFLGGHDPDGIESICVKSELGENVDRSSAHPELYYLPPYLGKRGWFGIRVDRPFVDWQDVESAVRVSYRLAAPKSLLKAVS